MNLKTLQSAMITAMKNHEKERKDTISSLIGAIKKAAIDRKCKDTISEELINEVILKEKKTVQEMIDTCPDNRIELINTYNYRLSVINEFAPILMTDEETLKEYITNLLSEAQISTEKNNKGQIMKHIMPIMKGKADMKIVNKVIGELLV